MHWLARRQLLKRSSSHCSLKEVEHSDRRLYLVFEWLDKDLKNYMDSAKGGMGSELVKVRAHVVNAESEPWCTQPLCALHSPTCTSCCWAWTFATSEASCTAI